MVRHIVIFRLNEDLDAIQKQQIMVKFRSAIEALSRKLDIIRHIEVGFNANEDEKCDICLYSEFDSMEDVNTYKKYPDHVEASSELKKYVVERACVDF